MTPLRQRIQNALNESRTLMLVTQVMLGFQYRSVFEPDFDRLSDSSRLLKLGAIVLTLLAIAALLLPAGYHRIAQRGRDSEALHAWTTVAITVALLPFALSLALDLWIHVENAFGRAVGAFSAGLGGVAALAAWYGPVAWRAHAGPGSQRRRH